MTPLPPACVKAAREALGREETPGCTCTDGGLCHACLSRIARAVLDAFVAGEGEGPWEVRPLLRGGARVERVTPPKGLFIAPWMELPKEAQARAVVAVLNYLEAKGE